MTRGYDDHLADAPAWQGGTDNGGPGQGTPAERSFPGLHREERLPWLDAGDELDGTNVHSARVWIAVLAGMALLTVIAGGVWWTTHRDARAQLADGGIIAAPPGAIKEAPQDPGGKTFDGTGDSSFSVSQGHSPGSSLAGGGGPAGDGGAAGTEKAGAPDIDAQAPDAVGGTSAGAVGVQLGAFSTELAAQAAWDHLAKTHDALSGATHRIVEGKADIGSVYRLQAVASSDAAATALCERLKAAGLNCQVQD